MPLKTILAIASFVAGLEALHFLFPKIPLRIPDREFVSSTLTLEAKRPDPTLGAGESPTAGAAPTVKEPASRSDTRPIDDPRHLLDPFYAALLESEKGDTGAVTTVLHYGDSPTTADLITADVRGLLQKRFGNAGHGFCLIAKPWAWYMHHGVEMKSSGWEMFAATQNPVRDGSYGLGGASFIGSAGASARFDLQSGGHTDLEISYLKRPGGGEFGVAYEGQLLDRVDTDAPSPAAGFANVVIPLRTRNIELRVTRGSVRLFGVTFRKRTAGVLYQSLGLNGAYVSVLARVFNGRHWEEQLRHASPQLIIINYGTNESVYEKFVDYAYEKEMKEVIRRLRAALPECPILVMSPMDRGERQAGGAIGTPPVLVRLVGLQHRVALENGCAFFNTFEAMGGAGTMAQWYASQPRLVGADFLHPMPAGARHVGTLLYHAMLDGYNRYKLRRLQQKPVAVWSR